MANANRTDALGALADPTRRRLFEKLGTAGPLPVGELAKDVPVTRPAVSQHLKVLKDAGLVFDRADGTRRLYQVDPAGLAVLRTYLDQFWERSLAAFQAAAREQKGEQDDPGD